MDSMAFVERSVLDSVGGTLSAITVSVSPRPSRRLPAAPGWLLCSWRASSFRSAFGRRGAAWWEIGPLFFFPGFGRGACEGLCAVDDDEDRPCHLEPPIAKPDEEVAHDGRVLCVALCDRERVLSARQVDPHRHDTDVIAEVHRSEEHTS